MTKQEFDAALDYMMSVPPRTLVELQRDLRKLKLRIVPNEPVAWRDPANEMAVVSPTQPVWHRSSLPLYADPTEN